MAFVLVFSLVVFGAVMLLGALVLKSRVLPFDRRGRLDRGRFDLPLSAGNCAATLPVTVHVSAGVAGEWVAGALERLKVQDVVMLDSWTLAGWTGMTWSSYGQQVGVAMQQSGPDQMTLWCCSRPRLATTMLDFGASKRSAGLLAATITQLAGTDRVSAA